MSEFIAAKIYGIIGFPLGHSLSPMLHTEAFKMIGWPGTLTPWPMETSQLPLFIEAARLLDIQGACVTIPHKQAIIPLLDQVSNRVKAVGAVNLIYRGEDGRFCGENTDVPGFIAPLKAHPPAVESKVLLLGAGGASRAVAAGLLELGYQNITVTGHNPASPQKLAADFGLKAINWENRHLVDPQLIINTTPLGMLGKFENETPYEASWLAGRPGIVYDIVYTPLATRFQREAEAAGWRTISGLEMFLGQADHQFRTWTGQPLPCEAKQLVKNHLLAAYKK